MFNKQQRPNSDLFQEQLKALTSRLQTIEDANKRLSIDVSKLVEVFPVMEEVTTNICSVLDKHLMLSQYRLGLENSSLGAFDSLKIGLNNILQEIEAFTVGDRDQSKKYDGLRRKLRALLNEFNFLDSKSELDSLLIRLNKDQTLLKVREKFHSVNLHSLE